LFQQQSLLSGSKNYSVIFVKFINHQYCGELFTIFKLNQLSIVLIITNITDKGINLGLINSSYTVGIFNLIKNSSRSYLTAYNILIIVLINNKNNNRNSPLIVGIVFLGCLYPQCRAGTLAVT
jgi:hypothetical protein